jgi:hypothetical protein
VVLQVVGQIEQLSGDGTNCHSGRRPRRRTTAVRAQPVGVTEQGRGRTAQLNRRQVQRAYRGGRVIARLVALRPGGEQGTKLPAATIAPISSAAARPGRNMGPSSMRLTLAQVNARNG